MYCQEVYSLFILYTLCHSITCRWLAEWNISIASEKKLRKRAQSIVTDNLKGEAVPLTFPLKSGGEEIQAAPFIYIPELKDKVFQLLDSYSK